MRYDYPILSPVTFMILSIQITEVSVKHSFPILKWVLGYNMMKIKGNAVDELVIIRINYRVNILN